MKQRRTRARGSCWSCRSGGGCAAIGGIRRSEASGESVTYGNSERHWHECGRRRRSADSKCTRAGLGGGQSDGRRCQRGAPRARAGAPAGQASVAPVSKMAAHSRVHRRAPGRRVFPLPRGGDDAQHGVDRRRLRQRPRDVGGSAGRRPGARGLRRRQLSREEGRLARAARQGAVRGSSRGQESSGHGG